VSVNEVTQMKSPRASKRRRKVPKTQQAKSMSTSVARRASIFRNGANQAVRLPHELVFPDEVKEVRIRKQGDGLLISPIKPNWAAFFRSVFVSEGQQPASFRGSSPRNGIGAHRMQTLSFSSYLDNVLAWGDSV
jgi:antitoxin VapB